MREGLRSWVAALLGAAALAGCARVDAPAGAGGRHPWTIAGHLRVGWAQEPDALNKLLANNDASDQLANLLFEPVFRYDPDGNFVPAMATTVPTYANGGISRDNRTITLHLRPGMTWSDGAPLDARDVIFTWRAVMNPRNNTRLRAGWEDIATMSARDPLTVVITLRRINAGILGIFGSGGGAAYPPLPAHVLEQLPDINQAPFNAKPISSGPFVLTDWQHGSALELAANDRYWRGRPKLDRITWRIIPNNDTLLATLRTHDIDVYDPVTEGQIGALGQLTGVTVTKRLIANWRHLEFNCRRPNLSDARVRRAIAEAIDWDRMNRVIYHGYNERARSDVFPLSWAAPHDVPFFPHDIPAAKQLLEAAGWKPGADGVRVRNGVPLHVSISTTVSRQDNIQAELQMQQELKAVGIDLEIKNYQTALLFAQNGPLYSGRYDMSFTIDTNGPDPDNEGLWSGRFIPPHGANTSFFDDPVITRTSHAALLTFDRAERAKLYDEEERRIHEIVPAVFLYWQNAYIAYNSDLHGFKPSSFISDFWNGWELSI